MIVVTAVERDNDGQDIFRQLRLTHVTPGHTVTTHHLLLVSVDGGGTAQYQTVASVLHNISVPSVRSTTVSPVKHTTLATLSYRAPLHFKKLVD